MNIIFNNQTNIIRQFGSFNAVELNDIRFYIPKESKQNLYILISDQNQHTDVLQMTKTNEAHSDYYIYTVSLENTVSNKSGTSSLLLFYFEQDKLINSNSLSLNISFTQFKSALEVYTLQKISTELAETYSKITELTKLNIALYEDIKEVSQR